MVAVAKTETGCRPSQWFGEWSVIPEALSSWVAIVQGADLAAVSAASAAGPSAPLYTVSADGLATINISGPMAKYGSSVQSLVGGSSTLMTQQALRQASRDGAVNAIMLRIDSPGGTFAGSGDLAQAVATADQKKPTYAYIEDLGASAAYRVASRARKVYANADAQIGSIGTFAVMEDTSGAYAKEGIKVHVVSTGPHKGTGVEGTPITDAHLEETQRRVNALNEQFLMDVSRGRHMPMDKVRSLADGRVHLAAAAKDFGLIDSVASWEQATREIGRALMEEQNLRAATERAEAAEALAAKRDAELAELRAQLGGIKAKEDLDAMKASLGALKNLPAKAAGLAEALVAIKAAAPDAFAVLETSIRAWDAQVKVGALFEEKGTTIATAPTVDINDPEKFRAAADDLVKDGKFKTRYEAMRHLQSAHAQEGK